MPRICTTVALFLLVTCANAQGSPEPFDAFAIERAIEAALINRVDETGSAVGIIVGVVTPQGRQYLTRGVGDVGSQSEITAETIFEIGSITKVFTALLLADMVAKGEVALSDPVDLYFPDQKAGPSFNGTRITLADLATHTSGLPFNPPAHVNTPSDLYDYVAEFELDVEPGTEFRYSNLAFGLLGHLLSSRAGKSYETLLRERIFEPLEMWSTTITVSESQRGRIATGHNSELEAIGLTDVVLQAGAGAMRSTASDLLTFSEAWLGLIEHPLGSAMQTMLSISRPMPRPDRQTHLGWAEVEGKALFHIGATRGFTASFTIRPDMQRAVIVLSNSAQRVDTIALHGVMPERPITMFEIDAER